jgi:hypothetical protein
MHCPRLELKTLVCRNRRTLVIAEATLSPRNERAPNLRNFNRAHNGFAVVWRKRHSFWQNLCDGSAACHVSKVRQGIRIGNANAHISSRWRGLIINSDKASEKFRREADVKAGRWLCGVSALEIPVARTKS